MRRPIAHDGKPVETRGELFTATRVQATKYDVNEDYAAGDGARTGHKGIHGGNITEARKVAGNGDVEGDKQQQGRHADVHPLDLIEQQKCKPGNQQDDKDRKEDPGGVLGQMAMCPENQGKPAALQAVTTRHSRNPSIHLGNYLFFLAEVIVDTAKPGQSIDDIEIRREHRCHVDV